MYFIAGFGILLVLLSTIMFVSPGYWSKGIVTFSQKPYFHWFEVSSRLIAGVLLLIYHQTSLYPDLIFGFGVLLVAVGLGLVISGAERHRNFAVWSAKKFKPVFRGAGLSAFLFGCFLVYAANLG
ncbi:hypothetical protein SG34_018640 [Thalassomonas viridans]|uniref:Uncharacterized protein n=1 Tax=Thalassomonas viridans TaxID=137584 RepID=A0AAF0C7Q1_9GAMM|nr:hypothetical protein [Thalassomonas viridans]WDE03405.1 hypothetical protein SG34_018640 [Thalassomonas viridans]